MNMLEAISYISANEDPYMWARPVSMRGLPFAYTVRNGRVMSVPGPSGAYHALFPDVQMSLEEWEIVNPDCVCDGD